MLVDRKEKWDRLMVRHPRWADKTMEQLRGADYALRVLHTSTIIRGQAIEVVEELIGQVRAEMKVKAES